MDYTFTNFVVGSSNQFAYAAAYAVAHTPVPSYNPLVLYGGRGVGKTHLLQAIGQHLAQHHPAWSVVYCQAEQRMPAPLQMLPYYCQADVLLVDDLHRIIGQPQTQEAFLHVFDALYAAQKPIVVSSAKTPQDLAPLVARLRSRLVAGLMVSLQSPDLETRLAILVQKATAYGIALPLEVARVIALHACEHGHALQQSLTRIAAYASLHARPLDRALAEHILHQEASVDEQQAITVLHVQQVVSRHFGLQGRALRSKQRQQALVFPRQMAMFLCRECTEVSLRDIGRYFGGRSYSTVLHACTKVARLEKADEGVARVLWQLRQALQA